MTGRAVDAFDPAGDLADRLRRLADGLAVAVAMDTMRYQEAVSILGSAVVRQVAETMPGQQDAAFETLSIYCAERIELYFDRQRPSAPPATPQARSWRRALPGLARALQPYGITLAATDRPALIGGVACDSLLIRIRPVVGGSGLQIDDLGSTLAGLNRMSALYPRPSVRTRADLLRDAAGEALLLWRLDGGFSLGRGGLLRSVLEAASPDDSDSLLDAAPVLAGRIQAMIAARDACYLALARREAIRLPPTPPDLAGAASAEVQDPAPAPIG